MNNNIILTDNGIKLLSYMQKEVINQNNFFIGKDLGEYTGIKGIYPVLQSLKKNGLVDEGESISRDFTNNKGVTLLKTYKTYYITDKGKTLNITNYLNHQN